MDLPCFVGDDLAMAFGACDLFAGGVNLNLQAVNAAIDLDYQRLQIDGLAFVIDEMLAGSFGRGLCSFDRRRKTACSLYRGRSARV